MCQSLEIAGADVRNAGEVVTEPALLPQSGKIRLDGVVGGVHTFDSSSKGTLIYKFAMRRTGSHGLLYSDGLPSLPLLLAR
jgi:hypothetical protein